MTIDRMTNTLAMNPRVERTLGAAGLLSLSMAFGLAYFQSDGGMTRFLYSYLITLSFFLSIGLGALFFVILQHLTNARWSVAIRRVAELLSATIAPIGVLSLPILLTILLGSSDLYRWNDPSVVASDPLIAGKAAYLNGPFFVVRCVGYFVIWSLLANYFLKSSLKLEEPGNTDIKARLQSRSGPAMLIFALTVNFAAFDLLMSLDPHWFSTIFGVYFFGGCVVALLAVLPLAISFAQKSGTLREEVTTDHFHDLGKLLFGFVMFWAYIAFSQYLLIWYANIPEETHWYAVRQNGSWSAVGITLLAGHFVLPFFVIMSRRSRRSRATLLSCAAFILVMHWLDLYWIVAPNFIASGPIFGLTDFLILIGMGCLWSWATLRQMSGRPLVAYGDPALGESLAFHT